MSRARRLAAYERLGILLAPGLLTLSEDLSPQGAMAVMRQLCYALVALAQEEPDPATLLSSSELEAALREHVQGFLDRVFGLIPEGYAPL